MLKTPPSEGSTVRFDGFLVSTAGVASLLAEAADTNALINSSLPSQSWPEGELGDCGVERDQALIAVLRETLTEAAMSALDRPNGGGGHERRHKR